MFNRQKWNDYTFTFLFCASTLCSCSMGMWIRTRQWWISLLHLWWRVTSASCLRAGTAACVLELRSWPVNFPVSATENPSTSHQHWTYANVIFACCPIKQEADTLVLFLCYSYSATYQQQKMTSFYIFMHFCSWDQCFSLQIWAEMVLRHWWCSKMKMASFCWTTSMWRGSTFSCFTVNNLIVITLAYIVQSVLNRLCRINVQTWTHLHVYI